MERSEPSLAPQWLRAGTAGSSSTSNAGHSNQQSGLSSRAVDRVSGTLLGNWLTPSASDQEYNLGASPLRRASSSNSRRGTSTNGAVARDRDSPNRRPYSSFGRSYRDRDRERDFNRHRKERILDNGVDDVFGNFVAGRDEKGNLLRSQSMIARRQNDPLAKRSVLDSSGVLPITGSSASTIHRSSFDRDFPSLVSDEKQNSQEIGRVPSPGLSIASASSLGNTTAIRFDSWTSALADVPPCSLGNGISHAPLHPSSPCTISSVTPVTSGLNMAETLAQAPLRVRSAPEVSVETQRLEELAIKKSRQLIPVTPSTTKTTVIGSSDKLKAKAIRSGDTSLMKVVAPFSAQQFNPALRGAARCEFSKGSQGGNFHVLNRDRSCFVANSKEHPNSGELSFMLDDLMPKNDMKSRVLSANGSSERRPLQRTQDRTDFFNSLRKKMNGCQEKDGILSVGKKGDQIATTIRTNCENTSLAHPKMLGSDMHIISQNGKCEESKEAQLCSSQTSGDDAMYSVPTEEEFKFLRELGWKEDENVEQITDEEIESFRIKHMSKVSSSILCPLSQQ